MDTITAVKKIQYLWRKRKNPKILKYCTWCWSTYGKNIDFSLKKNRCLFCNSYKIDSLKW